MVNLVWQHLGTQLQEQCAQSRPPPLLPLTAQAQTAMSLPSAECSEAESKARTGIHRRPAATTSERARGMEARWAMTRIFDSGPDVRSRSPVSMMRAGGTASSGGGRRVAGADQDDESNPESEMPAARGTTAAAGPLNRVGVTDPGTAGVPRVIRVGQPERNATHGTTAAAGLPDRAGVTDPGTTGS